MEDIRVYAAVPGDPLEPMPNEPLLNRVAQLVRAMLGERTRFAWARDGVEGFWVSFFIDVDEYWIALPRECVLPDETRSTRSAHCLRHTGSTSGVSS